MPMTLRPILKPLPHSYNDSPLPFASSSRIPPLDSPHVHFPPTPVMTKISITHSSFSYDRAPIQVAPNVCALPERGERMVGGGGGLTMSMKGGEVGGYFQPHAYYMGESVLFASSSNSPNLNNPRPTPPAMRTTNRAQSSPSSSIDGYFYPYLSPPQVAPPLVFDHSSESEEDFCGSPPSVDHEVIGGESAPHISVHLSGFSMGPSISTSSSGTHGREGVDGLGGTSSSYGVSPGKKSRSHRHAKRELNEGMLLGRVGGMSDSVLNRTRSRSRRVVDSTTSGRGGGTLRSGAFGFNSPLCDSGLEGCLGGF